MQWKLVFTSRADSDLTTLELDPSKKATLKAVKKALGYLETNIRHPSLHTHEFTSLSGSAGEKVFEAYAENKRPGAYRIFWHYGPMPKVLTIIAITPHPE